MPSRVHSSAVKSNIPINTILVAKQQTAQPVNAPQSELSELSDPKYNFNLSKISISSPDKSSSQASKINPFRLNSGNLAVQTKDKFIEQNNKKSRIQQFKNTPNHKLFQKSQSIIQRQSPTSTKLQEEQTKDNQTETAKNDEPRATFNSDIPWYKTGNLRGNPPVHDRENPPNKNIIEDNAIYQQRLNAAKAMLQNQRKRANALVETNWLGQECIRDYRYWFAKVYSHVTKNEIDFAESNTYYYPSYVMASVLYFDKIYEDNFNAFEEGSNVEEHWLTAFAEARERQDATWQQALFTVGGAVAGVGLGSLLNGIKVGLAAGRLNDVVVSLTTAMKAHIRYDLPRSEAWVFNSYYSHFPNAKISDFQADFMSMSGVFDNAALAMNDDMAQKLGIPESVMIKIMPQLIQDWSMRNIYGADMATERADTWQRAEELVNSRNAGTDPYNLENGQLNGNVTNANNMSGLQNLSAGLRPEMDNAASVYDDNNVREMSREQIKIASTTQRIRMLRGLFTGFTGNDDENRIKVILEISQDIGDVVTVIDGADPWDLAYATDDEQYTRLRQFFKDYYYGKTAQNNALRIIRKCLDGETAEWEEEMVIDILEKHPNARSIIEEIGRIYQPESSATGRDADYKNGLYKLEWQLDGKEEEALKTMFGSSNQGWWNF